MPQDNDKLRLIRERHQKDRKNQTLIRETVEAIVDRVVSDPLVHEEVKNLDTDLDIQEEMQKIQELKKQLPPKAKAEKPALNTGPSLYDTPEVNPNPVQREKTLPELTEERWELIKRFTEALGNTETIKKSLDLLNTLPDRIETANIQAVQTERMLRHHLDAAANKLIDQNHVKLKAVESMAKIQIKLSETLNRACDQNPESIKTYKIELSRAHEEISNLQKANIEKDRMLQEIEQHGHTRFWGILGGTLTEYSEAMLDVVDQIEQQDGQIQRRDIIRFIGVAKSIALALSEFADNCCAYAEG